jgi:hypothetical protein
MGHTLRSSGLHQCEASLARVFLSDLKDWRRHNDRREGVR